MVDIDMANTRPLIIGSLVVAALGWVGLARHAVSSRTVWFVDGSDRAYNIVIDGQEMRLQPDKPFSAPIGMGVHHIHIKRTWAPALDIVVDNSVPFLVAPFALSKAQFVNPDGCAVLRIERREYTISEPAPDEVDVDTGRLWWALDVDFPFTPFPESVSGRNRVVKTRVSQVRGDEGLELVGALNGERARQELLDRCQAFEQPGPG